MFSEKQGGNYQFSFGSSYIKFHFKCICKKADIKNLSNNGTDGMKTGQIVRMACE